MTFLNEGQRFGATKRKNANMLRIEIWVMFGRIQKKIFSEYSPFAKLTEFINCQSVVNIKEESNQLSESIMAIANDEKETIH